MSEGQADNKGSRFNKGKLRWSLVHFKSLEPLVRVLEFGARKYGDDNWKLGLDKKEILESMMRHLTALMDGEQNDKESGLHHIGHIMCNAMFYSYFHSKEEVQQTSSPGLTILAGKLFSHLDKVDLFKQYQNAMSKKHDSKTGNTHTAETQ